MNVDRRQLLAALLGSVTGTVVLAQATPKPSSNQSPAGEPLQDRADRVAQNLDDEDGEEACSFLNGGFRRGGFVNGGFRNGGGGGGGFRNGGFVNGGFRNGGGGGSFRNGSFRNW